MVVTEEDLARIVEEIREEMYLEMMTMPFVEEGEED